MAKSTISQSPVHALSKAPSSEEEWLGFIDDVWGYARQGRSGLEYRVREAMHFLIGEQWVRFSPHSNRFERHAVEDWVPTPVDNVLIEFYDYLVDLFTSGNTHPDVRPATRDQDDVEAAKAARRALISEFDRMNTEGRLLPGAAGWLALSGNAILSSAWDSHKGDLVRRPQMETVSQQQKYDQVACPSCGWTERKEAAQTDRCPECQTELVYQEALEYDIYGTPLMESVTKRKMRDGAYVYDEFRVGNLDERVCNLLNWYPMPSRDWRDVQQHGWVVETDPVDVDRIKDLFGSKAKDVMAEALNTEDFGSSPVTQFGSGIFSGNQDQDSDKALLKIFRHAPSKKFKEGILTISVANKLLYKGKLDSCDGKLPYTLIKYREVPGMFWGEGPIPDLIPQQKRLNAIDSAIVQNRKQNVSPQWLIPEGSGISKVTGRSGAVYRWSPQASGGFKPERMPGMPLPTQVMDERSKVVASMNQQVGLPEIMRGNLPVGSSGLETGAAVEFLFERAYKRFGQAVRNWRIGLSEHYHRNLRIMAKYWDEERMVKVIGENQELQSYYYSKADMASADDMTVSSTVGLEESQVGRTEKILQAVKMGLLGDIRNPAVRGKILEDMKLDGFDSEYVLDAKKARRVLRDLREGNDAEAILPEVDNHQVQFQIIKDYMLTYEFSQENDEVKQAILQRAMQHQQIMQQKQQQMMQAAQAAKGTNEQVSQRIVDSGAMGGEAQTQQVGAG